MKYQEIIIIRRITIIGPNNIISIMVGVLRNNTKTLEKKLKRAGTTVSIELLQKVALLGQHEYSERC